MSVDPAQPGAPTLDRPNPRPQPRVAEATPKSPTEAVEPVASLRERRRERRRARERPPLNPRLVALVVVISLLVVVFGGYGLSRSPLLDLDHITVEGNARTPSSAVVDVSQLRRGTPLTDVRLRAAKVAIERLPWVDEARLSRRWPGTVSIRIVERVPVAAVTTSDHVVVVDRGGRVLDRSASGEGFTALAPIVIADPAVEVGQVQPGLSGLLAMATALPDDLRSWVTTISRDDLGTPVMRLRDDVVVVFGDLTQLSGKYIDLATVLTRVELKDICRINLSAVHTPAVVRRPNCAASAG